jgi:chemotaxis protein MotB
VSARRKRHHEEQEEHGPDERWMASYMDMVTVLMCMFIVLFAMSTVDSAKFYALRNSLATGFGVKDIGRIDTAKGTIVPPDKADKKSESFANAELAVKEVDALKALQAAIAASLASAGLTSTVDFEINERGLVIRIVGSQTFFATNSTALIGVAPQVLNDIAPAIVASPYDVSVEGHADVRQSTSPFPTNWELSSGRAVSVLRHLVEIGGIRPDRIGAVGYGSSRPIATGTNPDELARNRRVDIVVLSNQPEAVRALMPGVVASEAAAAAAPATPEPSGIGKFTLPVGVPGR